jgi:hypothetical protein
MSEIPQSTDLKRIIQKTLSKNQSDLSPNNNSTGSSPSLKTSHFESLLSEFKQGRSNVINIMKIVIAEKQQEEFKKILSSKFEQNSIAMAKFIKGNYSYFVESKGNMDICHNLIYYTNEIVDQLEGSIQEFLSDFSQKFIEKIKRKEDLQNVKEQQLKLKAAYLFFGYMNKAASCMKNQQFESTIRLMQCAEEKYLKEFPINSSTYKRGKEYLDILKKRISQSIEERLTTWLIQINKEQSKIGETLFMKLKNEREKQTKSKSAFKGESNLQSNIRTTKNIVENLLLIRNTSNLNYLMNKNAALKSAVEGVEEYDIINMVSNVDLNFLESNYGIYKKVDIDTKYLTHFYTFRFRQLQSMIKEISTGRIDNEYNNEDAYQRQKSFKKLEYEGRAETESNPTNFAKKNSLADISAMNLSLIKRNSKNFEINFNVKNYNTYFSDILGYLIITLTIHELFPIFYSKRKFEELMSYFFKELCSNINIEFNHLTFIEDFLNLQSSIFTFIDCLDCIGVSDRTSIDPKANLLLLMKEKAEDLNFMLIKKYDNLFLNLLCEEKYINLECHNEEDYNKYCKQYFITLEEETMNYPLKLPFTVFVIQVNENFKSYFNEIYNYISPLYSEMEFETFVPNILKTFLDKINEVFHTFSNFQDQEMNIILAAHICNNIQYLSKSKKFFINFVTNKCHINSDSLNKVLKDDFLQKTWENYEEIIYENLKNKIKQFIDELIYEDWMPEKPNNSPHPYVESLLSYLMIIYDSLSSLSFSFIKNCFKDAMNYIPVIYIKEVLLNLKSSKNYNFYFIENLKFDIEELSLYFSQIGLSSSSLNLLKGVLSIFYNKKIDNNLFQSGEVKLGNLIEFLLKYKNVKKNELKGKITESEISSIVKKLKENK